MKLLLLLNILPKVDSAKDRCGGRSWLPLLTPPVEGNKYTVLLFTTSGTQPGKDKRCILKIFLLRMKCEERESANCYLTV